MMMIWWWIIGLGLLSLVVFFYTGKNKNRPVEKRRESPMNILKERYAKGEITKEEFENQKKTLSD
ncbi:SHOCT domain-containing protein [Gillisia sp. Hel_I_29]|uniref:SHOCT domain-containing protein n=1 Tax=Gillisia sp. Hel_I_29 TaxID=1249975 RepID=UPI000B17C0ED|nr:SHOCT domain-containing protein [Gillisia sp. Hel_I_29]